jgi:alkanesulfonate monooxygenase SsuD/methylene tetrahydromethanopterin reductase-like flavin-dependent oxidoreductase (luciferase family)
MIRLGTFLLAAKFPGHSHSQALAGALQCGLASEAAGLDSVWIAEHHFIAYGTCPSATTFAANLLGRTQRIQVGTAVSILSNQHPVALAEQTALLDHLSGGRFHLGVGRGGPWVDLEVFATGLDRFEHGFPESLDLLLGWLTQPRVAGNGERFRFREVQVVPRPYTRPHPPVIVAATTPATVALAAERGLPILLGMHEDDDGKATLLAHYRQVAHAHGHDPDVIGPQHAAAALVHLADSHAAAAAELRARMPAWLAYGLGGYVRIAPASRPPRDPHAYIEHLLGIHPVGTPEQCAERLATTAERTGIGRFLLLVEGVGDHRRAAQTIAYLGAEVLPLLTGRRGRHHRDGGGGPANHSRQRQPHDGLPGGR